MSDDVLNRLRSVEYALREKEYNCGCKIGPTRRMLKHCGGHAFKSVANISWAHGVIKSIIKDLDNEHTNRD